MRADATRNRARILDATRALVARDGPAVSMDDIARAAGVAVGTLYRHFATKQDLVAAVVHDSLDLLAAVADQAMDAVRAGASAGEQLAGLFRLVAARRGEDAAVKEAAVALGAPAPGADGRIDFAPGTPERRAVDAVEALVRAAVAEGTVRPDLTVADLFTLVSGVPPEPFAAGARDRYVEIVLAGIRRP